LLSANKGMLVFARDSRGQDVQAACGQLALAESAALESKAEVGRLI